jgi:hypothetical protein
MALCFEASRTSSKQQPPLRAVKPISRSDGMAALGRTPVLPEATPVGALSAQLRRSRPRSAMAPLRRFEPSGVRKYRSFPCGTLKGSNRPLAPLQVCFDGRAVHVGMRSFAERDRCAWLRRPKTERDACATRERILSVSLAQALGSMVRSKRLRARLPLMPTPIPYFVNGQPLLAAVG